MSSLAVTGLSKRFAGVRALDGISFSVAAGEFFCIVGPTNAGKSTLLKLIAGLHRADAGRIFIDGRDVSLLAPHQRQVSLLFQNAALFPTRTGFANIAFPLLTAKVAADRIAPKVKEIAERLQITHLLHRLPGTFSGGEQQRVAIARALVHPSKLLMLDEPLTNLDARLRIALRIEFKKLHRDLGQTFIYVTHDQVEAMSLSDRVAVLNEGVLQQLGSPQDIYQRPINRFVAEFIGSPPMNIIDAEIRQSAGEPSLVGAGFSVPLPGPLAAKLPHLPPRLAFAIRPEAVAVAPAPSAATPLPADVVFAEHLGNRSVLALRLGTTLLKAVVPPQHAVKSEGRAFIGLRPQPQHLLDRDTGQFLPVPASA